mmetsp:Transcript_37181/g.102278  ORF Transcript_37181/g.102278 Transcript_37181/m.102278 type:complete len:98 (+) Transcript_37181:88-381(+)
MLRNAIRIAARQPAVVSKIQILAPAVAPTKVSALQPLVRTFGAVTPHKGETAAARPFKGASRTEPDMEYIEEPSMLYMVTLLATPVAFSFWFLTKFV